MKFIDINSHDELINKAINKKNYLLLYKKSSEQSECAIQNITKITEIGDELSILIADVSQVRDIHPKYSITSVPTLVELENNQAKNIIKGCQTSSYYQSLFADNLYRTQNNAEGKKQAQVTVYSTPSCSWCTTLKSYLRKNNIRFTDIDVSKNQKAAEEMVKKSGQQGVPQSDINGQRIIGFDQKKIDQLLEIN